MKTLNEHDLRIAQHIADRLDARYHKVSRALGAQVVILIACIVAFALLLIHANHEIQDGRRAGTNVSCAAIGAIAEAGRQTIEQGSAAIEPDRFRINLEKLGLPPVDTDESRKRAHESGQKYVTRLNMQVQERTGIQDLIRKDGTLNCSRLREAAGL